MGYRKRQPFVFIYTGTIANIPKGYILCDGNNGTPDLAEKFIRGAADSQNAGGTGGETSHYHDFSGDTDYDQYSVTVDNNLDGSYGYVACYGHTHNFSGSVDSCTTVSPYYDVLFVMHK